MQRSRINKSCSTFEKCALNLVIEYMQIQYMNKIDLANETKYISANLEAKCWLFIGNRTNLKKSSILIFRIFNERQQKHI